MTLSTLETKRLILRPVAVEDMQAIYDYSSDELVTQYVSYDTYTSMADAQWAMDHLFMNRDPLVQFDAYALVHKETKRMIGTVDFGRIRFGDITEVGYVMHREFWGQGLMTEALKAACLEVFKHGIRRIEVCHYEGNIGSKRVIEKTGFVFEGIKRQFAKTDKGYLDCPFYSLLKGDI